MNNNNNNSNNNNNNNNNNNCRFSFYFTLLSALLSYSLELLSAIKEKHGQIVHLRRILMENKCTITKDTRTVTRTYVSMYNGNFSVQMPISHTMLLLLHCLV